MAVVIIFKRKHRHKSGVCVGCRHFLADLSDGPTVTMRGAEVKVSLAHTPTGKKKV